MQANKPQEKARLTRHRHRAMQLVAAGVSVAEMAPIRDKVQNFQKAAKTANAPTALSEEESRASGVLARSAVLGAQPSFVKLQELANKSKGDSALKKNGTIPFLDGPIAHEKHTMASAQERVKKTMWLC